MVELANYLVANPIELALWYAGGYCFYLFYNALLGIRMTLTSLALGALLWWAFIFHDIGAALGNKIRRIFR